ncbi:MAG: hypothetical protein R2864_03460 [Syntrophotaleaceae bacterium]
MAANAPLLTRMAKEDNLVSSRVTLEFSTIPAFRIVPSGQQVDLFFSDASVGSTLHLLPEDDKIVKILVAKSSKELMISLLLRQVPANISTTQIDATGTIDLELFWQQAGGSRPAVAFRISGLPSRQALTSSSQPLAQSPFSGRWHTFFTEYLPPLFLDLPLKVNLPSLPRHGFEETSAPFAAVLDALSNADSLGALERLQGISETDLNQQGLLSKQLLRAEALLRNGSTEPALAILEKLPRQQLKLPLQQRAGYLHNLALVLAEDPYGAKAWHADIEKLLADSPYRYPFQLLQAEIALQDGDGKLALNKLSQPDQRWPEDLRSIRLQRIADAQVTSGQSKAALPYFRQQIQGSGLPADDGFSFQQAARAFYENQDWETTHQLYQQLAVLLSEADTTSQALYLSNLATYLGGEQDVAMLQFRQLREDYPGTRGDLLAWMKMLDHGLATREERHLLQGLRDYPSIISKTDNRRLREEAIFKLGLALHLQGEPLRAIDTLGRFRRNYASSPLRTETEALLRDILPPQLERFIATGEDLQAVIMLEQYRELLIRGDGKWPFLPKLAKAFTRLGLVDRGCCVYLYLLDHAHNPTEAEQYYLPLASLYFDRDEYAQAERYSELYLNRYPKGADRAELFLLRLRALQKQARFDEAAKLLEDKQTPRSTKIELLAAEIYWELGDYNQVIDFANRLGNRGEAIPPAGLLLEAEALRRLGHAQQALPLFEVLAEDGTFSDQATYRCGQILLAKGDRGKALNLFRTLAEKGKDGLWRQLAQDSIKAETY